MKTIVADLDGTIIKTDLLFEGLVRALKAYPYIFFLLPVWVLQGRNKLKQKISEHANIDVKLLPYNKEVLWYLRSMKGDRCRVVLATASWQSLAENVAEHLDVFDAVYGSSETVNLKSSNKRSHILEKESGDIYYLGDSKADFDVWGDGIKAIPVGSSSFCKKVESKFEFEKSFTYENSKIKAFLKAIRIHQWAKNSLIFLPLMLTSSSQSIGNLGLCLLAILSFSLCASSVYLLNDMFDLDADRAHEKKSKRPLASGNLPISVGILGIPFLLFMSFAIAFSVGKNFSLVLGIYYIITSLYSFKLKSIALLDVILLAVLYTTRIFAGGAVIGVGITPWLLAFSMFFFLSLAIVKRVTELEKKKSSLSVSSEKLSGRGYWVSDLPILQQLGVGTGALSVLVFSLYLNTSIVQESYTHPNGLWFSCLFLFYWIARIWLLTSRGQMNDDPVVFAIKDKLSYFVLILLVLNFVYCL